MRRTRGSGTGTTRWRWLWTGWWQWLRAHRFSNRPFDDYDRIAAAARDSLDAQTIKSVCACPWAERALEA